MAGVRLYLLGGFRLEVDGRGVDLPHQCQRLTGFIALQGHLVARQAVSVALWPDDPPSRGRARIRCALWRLRQLGVDVVTQAGTYLALSAQVSTDLQDAVRAARHVIDSADAADMAFDADLLPDWDDEWVVVERERFRQLRLHALEHLCRTLSASGKFARAVDVGIEAVAAEPFRESAHRALIEVHLREGNGGEALRQFERYRLLAAELGLNPSSRLVELVQTARSGAPTEVPVTAAAP